MWREEVVAKQRLSIRKIVFLTVIIAFFLFAILTASFIFPRWFYLARETIGVKTKAMGDKAYNKISSMVKLPIEINESNTAIFERGLLQRLGDNAINLFFYDKLYFNESYIYSITYGDEEGNYYGARRLDDAIEILLNDDSTNHNTWFYTIDRDGYPLSTHKGGYYDPREREWYQVVVGEGSSAFSPILPSYYIDDLSITVGTPVYSANGGLLGVLASHILLDDINQIVGEDAQTYGGLS